MAAFAVRRLDSELQRRPLRAAWLQPANGEQTTAAAVALAEVRTQLTHCHCPSPWLVVHVGVRVCSVTCRQSANVFRVLRGIPAIYPARALRLARVPYSNGSHRHLLGRVPTLFRPDLPYLQHSHRLRANAAAPRELVVVPLLDDAALRDSDIAQHLDGIACLVLRALSEALTFLEDEEPTAEVEEAAAAKDEDAGLGYMYTCRVQHMHWQVSSLRAGC